MKTKYPIYIISKGRPKCITARSLKRIGVDFRIVVEPHQINDYKIEHPDCEFITTPFKNLNQGSIPVRNFVWDHAKNEGYRKHWVLDDNIEDFNRLNRNKKPSVRTAATFLACEDFTDRFENVWLSGMNYYSFCKTTDSVPPFYANTRIYSCILVDHRIPFRWRGKYNEDTDLSLRVLKKGKCTILFNAFLCGKVTTQRMSGGNTEDVYAGTNDRLEFAESLKNQHPDVVKVVRKFNRWHHQVNYKPFKKNKLIMRDDVVNSDLVNNYGMVLSKISK